MRWAHMALELGAAPVWRWTGRHRLWARPMLFAGLLAMIVFPFDGAITRMLAHWGIGDDRELKAWVQYGAIGSILFTAVVIWLLDRGKAHRVWDLATAMVINVLVCTVLKMLIARPRPKYGDPEFIAGPWGRYAISAGPKGPDGKRMDIVAYGWETLRPDLWSMPSSHTAAAVVLSVFLMRLYPPLKWPGIFLIGVVALGRVAVGAGLRFENGVFDGYTYGAHWASDVVLGAGVGLAVARVVIDLRLGQKMALAVGQWATSGPRSQPYACPGAEAPGPERAASPG